MTQPIPKYYYNLCKENAPSHWSVAFVIIYDLFGQAAQVVLISLFELNTPEFTMLLGALPKTFQDGATKLLHKHLKNSSNTSSSVVRAWNLVW